MFNYICFNVYNLNKYINNLNHSLIILILKWLSKLNISYQILRILKIIIIFQELNITSINIINAISKKVGAPSYRKTPVFKKKE